MKHFYQFLKGGIKEHTQRQQCKFCGSIKVTCAISGKVLQEDKKDCQRPKKAGFPGMLDAMHGAGWTKKNRPDMFDENGFVKNDFSCGRPMPPKFKRWN